MDEISKTWISKTTNHPTYVKNDKMDEISSIFEKWMKFRKHG
jgi:hypothetical protein